MTNNQHPLQQISFKDQATAFVIEASAGTGKTWTIERLYIKALLEGVLPNPDGLSLGVTNILVVTFTNDATDELKERISQEIQNTINRIIYLQKKDPLMISQLAEGDIFLNYLNTRANENPDFRKDLTVLTRALQNFDQAAIYTIHGFCKRILDDYRFECTTIPEFELVANNKVLIEDLLRDFMRSEIINNPALKNQLEIIMTNLERIFTASDYSQSLIERINNKLPNDLFKIENGEYKVKYNLGVVPSINLLIANGLSEEELKLAKSEFLAYVINYLAAHFPLRVKDLATMSYDELIQKLADSLIYSNGLSDKLFNQFPIAFIDEFQDTDSLQWQIFSQVYGLAKERRGSVVVVGDPKQAIYRFRGADVDTYIEAREQIGNCLELRDNFRSHPNIMNFINQLFSLDNQKSNIENGFLGNFIDYPLVNACATNKLELPSAEYLKNLAHESGVNAEFYDDEVQLVAINGATKDIRNERLLMAMTFEILALLKADPTLKGKIAILTTKNREANELVNYLRRYGVKAAELKLGNIFATTTAEELYTVLVSINDLANRRNFNKALAGKIFNLDLSELFIKNENNSNPVYEALQRQFFGYKSIWEYSGLISLIYSLINNSLLNHKGILSGVFSNRELANLWQLAELLNKQARKLHNHTELLYWFKSKIDLSKNEISSDLDGNNEELVRLDNDDEQIIITTQHKAKGLEYEILFCPFFKSGVVLDGQYDYNYRRPFFSSYHTAGEIHAELINDKNIGEQIVANDNKESHRLNYVALTRAKSRVYIYLKAPTISRATGKYNEKERPDKIVELFGYINTDPRDSTHSLFNYPQFFADDPSLAIKYPDKFRGVVSYNRNGLTSNDLDLIAMLEDSKNTLSTSSSAIMRYDFTSKPSYSRQSYSQLTSTKDSDNIDNEYFVKNEAEPLKPLEYRYSVLSDKYLRGATFGVLFHTMCESYPFTIEEAANHLARANLTSIDDDYATQLFDMISEAFNYHLIGNLTIGGLTNKSIHELEFNLTVVADVSISEQIADLIASYFGSDHPFSQSVKLLDKIESGFLVGFIDLFFEFDNKYWVLDYKTNTLDDYSAPTNCFTNDNSLIESMSDHHYYLQYLLYLVAIKRYLESRLQIEDATDLIGGSVYFYVRGIYTKTFKSGDGVYIDTDCQKLVRDLDLILKGINHA